MTRRIYMDNAATSFPKPPQVAAAMQHYALNLGASPGRGAYAEARESAALMQNCRVRLCKLIGADPDQPQQVIFTLNTTDSLNLAIRGTVMARSGRRHIITSDLDHNSVLRPFNALCASDPQITQTRVPCDPITGLIDPDDIRQAITPDTCLIAIVHGSNVSGTLQPIAEIGRIAKEHDIAYCVDAAQSLGHVPIDVSQLHVDLLAAPGHKGLLGPLGTGVLYIRPGFEKRMIPVREGGTGSVSERDVQPDFLPDRFEAGSHNAIGLIGLSEGIHWLLQRGVKEVWRHECELMRIMLAGLHDIDGLTFFGPRTLEHRCGVFSVRIEGYDAPLDLSNALEQQFGLLTRSGIHCAPHAHRTLGTLGHNGTTRFSFGPFLTGDDVRYAVESLARIAAAAHVPV